MSTSDHSEQQPMDVRLAWFRTVAVWAFLLALVLRFFEPFRFVVLALLAAAALASALRPLRDKLPGSRGVRAIVSGLVPAVAVLLVFGLLSYFLATGIQNEVSQWPQTRDSLNQLLARLSQRLHLDEPLSIEQLAEQILGYVSGSAGAQLASATASWVSTGLVALALLLFGTLYLLLSHREDLLYPPLKAFRPERRPQLTMAVDDLEGRLRWWIIGTAVSMGTVGLISGIAYSIIGLKMAIPLALLAGLAEMIPTLGPLFAFLVAMLFAATQGGAMMLGVAITYVILQTVESYALVPLVMKKAIHMPPVVTLFTLVLWGRVFGPAGLLLALPINLTILSFADRLLRRSD